MSSPRRPNTEALWRNLSRAVEESLQPKPMPPEIVAFNDARLQTYVLRRNCSVTILGYKFIFEYFSERGSGVVAVIVSDGKAERKVRLAEARKFVEELLRKKV